MHGYKTSYNHLRHDMSEKDDKKQVVAINTSVSNFSIILWCYLAVKSTCQMQKSFFYLSKWTFIDLWRVYLTQLNTTECLVHFSLRLKIMNNNKRARRCEIFREGKKPQDDYHSLPPSWWVICGKSFKIYESYVWTCVGVIHYQPAAAQEFMLP